MWVHFESESESSDRGWRLTCYPLQYADNSKLMRGNDGDVYCSYTQAPKGEPGMSSGGQVSTADGGLVGGATLRVPLPESPARGGLKGGATTASLGAKGTPVRRDSNVPTAAFKAFPGTPDTVGSSSPSPSSSPRGSSIGTVTSDPSTGSGSGTGARTSAGMDRDTGTATFPD